MLKCIVSVCGRPPRPELYIVVHSSISCLPVSQYPQRIPVHARTGMDAT